MLTAFDCRLARLAATLGSGRKQVGKYSLAMLVRLKTPAGALRDVSSSELLIFLPARGLINIE